MRKLLIVLLVLGLLVVAIDVFARRTAEDQVAGRLQRTFDLSSEPKVSVSGWPFLLQVLRGEIEEVEMTGDRVRSEDVTLEDFEVEIRDVRFSLADVIEGSGLVKAGGGEGSASITERSLNRSLEDADAPFTLSLTPGGVAAVTDQAEVEAGLTLEGNALSVDGEGLPSVPLDLPSMGGRVTYENLQIEAGRATLEFSVHDLKLNT